MPYQSQWKERSGEILSIASQVRSAHPDYWEALKIHGTADRRYINAVSVALISAGIPGGVNQKRGTQGDSIDAIALPNNTGATSAVGPYPAVEIIDLVGGAEGGPSSSPTLVWGDVTQSTIDKGEKGGWKAGVVEGGSTPVPPVPTMKPRDQFSREFIQVNDFYAAPEGLQRVGGMVSGVDASVFNVLRRIADGSITDSETIKNAAAAALKVQCDVGSMNQWGYDLMAGATPEQVIKQIRQSDEWKAKHPGETP